MRDRLLKPYYEKVFDGFVFLDGQNDAAQVLQRTGKVDTLAIHNNKLLLLEEKIVRPRTGSPYTAICIETDSCTVEGHESPGWIHTSRADWLFYCWVLDDNKGELNIISFPQLREWFASTDTSIFPTTTTDEHNRTRCKVIDIDHLKRDGVEVRQRRLVGDT